MENQPEKKSNIMRNCIIAGFLIGLFFGNGIGIAGSFGAINGGLVVGLIGAYVGFRVGQLFEKQSKESISPSGKANEELEALREQIKLAKNKD